MLICFLRKDFFAALMVFDDAMLLKTFTCISYAFYIICLYLAHITFPKHMQVLCSMAIPPYMSKFVSELPHIIALIFSHLERLSEKNNFTNLVIPKRGKPIINARNSQNSIF